ncbi:MAG: serine hydrolase domain-containing protein [Saprospiraceae bacterium]
MIYKKLINIILVIISLSSIISCSKVDIPPTTTCTDDVSFVINENHPKAAAIQTLMNDYIAQGLPGMSILINDDDGFWIASAGYADLENQIVMQPCHINKLGSVTKMMMGTLIWQLIQDGSMNINDPISKHIPEVAEKIENGDDITVAMLVNHTSGIYDVAGDLGFNLAVINDFSKHWTSEKIIKYLEGKPATHSPGETQRYSNSNTMLVGLIIDEVAGRHHSALLQNRILEPLGMESTVYYNYENNFPLPNLAQGYLDFHNDGKDIQNISNLNPGSGNGYTGVYSTVTDLYKFMNALLREKTLTTPENLDLIFGSMTMDENSSWEGSIGGIHNEFRNNFSDSLKVYGHSGGDIGYSANLNYLPHNNTIVAATYNYGTNLRSPLRDVLVEFRRKLYEICVE